jgi:hypothetical protein
MYLGKNVVKEQWQSGLQTPEGYTYIKGYLYPILYPKIGKKDIFRILFWSRIF